MYDDDSALRNERLSDIKNRKQQKNRISQYSTKKNKVETIDSVN